MPERLLLADSNSLIYRGYFAIPPLTTTKGELVNAAFGFASDPPEGHPGVPAAAHRGLL